MLTTTLNEIKSYDPCTDGWDKLLSGLNKTTADDETLTFERILESNGFDDALWACRVLTGADMKRFKLLICDYAERLLKFLPEGEDRPRIAIETARRFLNGGCTAEELRAAADAARAAAYAAADAAGYAASAAYHAASGAAAVAYAAGVVAYAARAAAARAAAYAARADAAAAERVEQIKMFKGFIKCSK